MAIGSTLRDARHRLGLDLPECESATRIRGRYLAALEDERFELLPERTYARGFLQQYAQYLGLDAEPLLRELNDVLGPLEPDEPTTDSTRRRASMAPPRRPRDRRGVWRTALLLVGGLAAVAVAIYLGGRNDPESPAFSASTTGDLTTPTATPPDEPVVTRSTPQPVTPSAPPRLSLAGRPPDGSWIQVRRRHAGGAILFEGTLAAGATRTYSLATPVWVRLGWGPGIRATVDSRVQALPEGTGDVVFTRQGRRAVSPPG
ncbi:MAG: DUF4115 domain-containing protein [Thermoleophilia bacterium]